jgi:hypothetical protein
MTVSPTARCISSQRRHRSEKSVRARAELFVAVHVVVARWEGALGGAVLGVGQLGRAEPIEVGFGPVEPQA